MFFFVFGVFFILRKIAIQKKTKKKGVALLKESENDKTKNTKNKQKEKEINSLNKNENIMIETFSCETSVEFAELSMSMIESYVETGEPMDKAGGYGMQGIGGQFIKSINGCYYNVVGFPLQLFCKHIRAFLNLDIENNININHKTQINQIKQNDNNNQNKTQKTNNNNQNKNNNDNDNDNDDQELKPPANKKLKV